MYRSNDPFVENSCVDNGDVGEEDDGRHHSDQVLAVGLVVRGFGTVEVHAYFAVPPFCLGEWIS